MHLRSRICAIAPAPKAREPARILVSISKSASEQGHLEYKKRWVDQYNFYLQDRAWGRMFVRICPYFPFPARVYLNQHYWLAQSLAAKNIRFQQCAHAFLRYSDPERLQQLADSLQPQDILRCAQKWLTALVPFFTAREPREAQALSNRGRRGPKRDFPDAARLVKRLVARELTLSSVPDAE